MHTTVKPFFLLVQRHHMLRNLHAREKTEVKQPFTGELRVRYLKRYVSKMSCFSTCVTNIK